MRLKLLFLLFLFHFSVYAQNREHAFEVNSRLGRGINMSMFEGNTNSISVSSWNPEYPHMISELGFNHVRIPIRWEPSGRSNPESPYNINPDFLDQIKLVIDSCMNNDLMVIINMHHHEALFADPDGQKERFLSQWQQISEFFKDYSDDLLFEILNEPHGSLNAEKWNTFLVDALTTIREDSPNRVVLIDAPEWGGVSGFPKLELPDDENIIATIHYYNPFSFTHQGAGWVDGADAWLGTKWNDTETERQRIRNEMAVLKTAEEEQNIPIHIGEFGAYGKADDASRKKWSTFMSRYIESLGWSWAYWEFSAGYGIYNPNDGTYRQFLVDALLHDTIPEPAYYEATAVYESNFSSTISEWDLRNNSGASSTKQRTDDQMVISISTTSGSGWHIQLLKYGIKLEAGKRYRVRFKAWADGERSITAYVGEGVEPWGAYGNYNGFTLTDITKEYSYTLDMTKNDNDARIKFDLGTSDANVHFEYVVLESIELKTPTSVEIREEIKSKIYPNPANQQLTINNADHFEQLIISNINGCQLISKPLAEQINRVEISCLASGIYFVTLLNQNSRFTKKIIKN